MKNIVIVLGILSIGSSVMAMETDDLCIATERVVRNIRARIVKVKERLPENSNNQLKQEVNSLYSYIFEQDALYHKEDKSYPRRRKFYIQYNDYSELHERVAKVEKELGIEEKAVVYSETNEYFRNKSAVNNNDLKVLTLPKSCMQEDEESGSESESQDSDSTPDPETQPQQNLQQQQQNPNTSASNNQQKTNNTSLNQDSSKQKSAKGSKLPIILGTGAAVGIAGILAGTAYYFLVYKKQNQADQEAEPANEVMVEQLPSIAS